MMQDYTLDDLITEVQRDFKVWLPKVVIKKIVVVMLRRIFERLHNKKFSVTMYGGSIARFYHRIDFAELEQNFMDVDESRNKPLHKISDKLLKVFHEKGSPRLKLRGKNKSTTLVFHKRTYFDKRD